MSAAMLSLVFDVYGDSQDLEGHNADGSAYIFVVRRLMRRTDRPYSVAKHDTQDEYVYFLVDSKGMNLTGGLTLDGVLCAVRTRMRLEPISVTGYERSTNYGAF
jgi:hypothetical protein